MCVCVWLASSERRGQHHWHRSFDLAVVADCLAQLTFPQLESTKEKIITTRSDCATETNEYDYAAADALSIIMAITATSITCVYRYDGF